MTISRTGYSGDLGFEVFVEADDALAVLDKVIQAGEGQGFRPFGEDALNMLRIEAGLSLIGVEFTSARYAFTDAERFTPKELGFGWMLGKDGGQLGEDRPFIGRRAIERELPRGHLSLGDGRPLGRLAGVRAGSTSSAASSCPRTRTRSSGSRCSTAARTATNASATPPA